MSNSTSYSLRNYDLNKLVYPDMAYIDTCYLLELDSTYTNCYQSTCKNFITNAANAGTLFTISGHVLDELQHSIIRAVYEKEAERQGIISTGNKPPWALLFGQDPSHMVTVDREVRRINEAIKKNQILVLDYESNENYRLLNRAISINYGLDTYDAKHISTMFQYDINAMITLDSHFLNVDGLNVYGPTKDIVNDSYNTNSTYIEFDPGIVDNIISRYNNSEVTSREDDNS